MNVIDGALCIGVFTALAPGLVGLLLLGRDLAILFRIAFGRSDHDFELKVKGIDIFSITLAARTLLAVAPSHGFAPLRRFHRHWLGLRASSKCSDRHGGSNFHYEMG